MLTTKGVKILRMLSRRRYMESGLTASELRQKCRFKTDLDAVATIEELLKDHMINKKAGDQTRFSISGVGELALKHENIYVRSYFIAKVACLSAVASLAVSFVALLISLKQGQ